MTTLAIRRLSSGLGIPGVLDGVSPSSATRIPFPKSSSLVCWLQMNAAQLSPNVLAATYVPEQRGAQGCESLPTSLSSSCTWSRHACSVSMMQCWSATRQMRVASSISPRVWIFCIRQSPGYVDMMKNVSHTVHMLVFPGWLGCPVPSRPTPSADVKRTVANR